MNNPASLRFGVIASAMAKQKANPPTLASARPAVVRAVSRVGTQLARQGVPVAGRVVETPRGLRAVLATAPATAPIAREQLRAALKAEVPAIASQLKREVGATLREL